MLEQEKLIKSVKAKATDDQRINCVLMYGSFTQGAGDEYSDVEFYVFINDSNFTDFISQQWISEIFPVYTRFFNEHGSEVVIFQNLVRAEFHFLPLSQVQIIEGFYIAGYFPDLEAMCLCDKSGLLQKALSAMAGRKVNHYSRENIESTISNLLNLVLMGINVYQRGEMARSLEVLSQAHRYYLQLLRLLNNSLDHWLNPYKQLETEISQADYLKFQQCSAPLEKTALARAYKNLLNASQHSIALLAGRFHTDTFAELLQKLQAHACI